MPSGQAGNFSPLGLLTKNRWASTIQLKKIDNATGKKTAWCTGGLLLFTPFGPFRPGLQCRIIKYQLAKRIHTGIEHAVIDIKIGGMMVGRFGGVIAFGHAAQVKKDSRRLFTVIKKIFRTGYPFQLTCTAWSGLR